jgi:hypothetical protein
MTGHDFGWLCLFLVLVVAILIGFFASSFGKKI